MNLWRLPALFIILSCCACTSGVGDTTDSLSDEFVAQQTMPSSQEIIAAMYDSSYSVPAGFFVDERADTPRSYTLYHVKDNSASYELCTDNSDQARAWEETDNSSRSVNGQYVGSVETENYYEFIRELEFTNDVGNVSGTTSPGFARVFKCSSVNRDGVDRKLRSGYGGILNQMALSPQYVREFVEYLWQFSYFETARRKVLGSYSRENASAFVHTLRLAFAINQGIGQCDSIEVVDWEFTVNKANGQITREFRFQLALEARLIDGIPEQCE